MKPPPPPPPARFLGAGLSSVFSGNARKESAGVLIARVRGQLTTHRCARRNKPAIPSPARLPPAPPLSDSRGTSPLVQPPAPMPGKSAHTGPICAPLCRWVGVGALRSTSAESRPQDVFMPSLISYGKLFLDSSFDSSLFLPNIILLHTADCVSKKENKFDVMSQSPLTDWSRLRRSYRATGAAYNRFERE